MFLHRWEDILDGTTMENKGQLILTKGNIYVKKYELKQK